MEPRDMARLMCPPNEHVQACLRTLREHHTDVSESIGRDNRRFTAADGALRRHMAMRGAPFTLYAKSLWDN
jgi:hypothetical protein